MKKILVITILGMLFCNTSFADTKKKYEYNREEYKDILDGEKSLFDSAGDVLKKVNPLNYFENKKKCQAHADRADTVAIGKRWYKDCMNRS